MAVLTRARVREYAEKRQVLQKTAADILTEHQRITAGQKEFDIFLSHRFADKVELVGLMQMMESEGLSVFVDWKERPELDRTKVTKDTAAALKEDMKRCKTLLFAVTGTASTSIWMPWELGLFDGMKGKVATVPLATKPGEFPGQEYAALYPWIDEATEKSSDQNVLWVNEAHDTYVRLKSWVKGVACSKRTIS
jgi:hypothetical protein